ncbi:unnamed protein product [Adineta ricciae]|uniref:Uncharacterized protein n=1 Tax=Adineta ricciae TaxID=249248 RepID=A0A813SZI1_ADIRI|nr:unnamed protein product [Adineta ricciae]
MKFALSFSYVGMADTKNSLNSTDAFGMENIFEQMRRYKEEADQLTGDERKQFAEKIILSLWKDFGDEDDASDEDNQE